MIDVHSHRVYVYLLNNPGNCRGNFAAENKIVLALMWMLYVKELLHNKPFQALHNHFKIVVPLSTALTGTRMIIVQRNHIK